MFRRWTKLILFLAMTPLFMSTSCIKYGPYYSVEHEIECPPAEYHLPMYEHKNGYTLELIDKIDGFCSGLPSYILKGKDIDYSYFYATLVKKSTRCFLVVAFSTYDYGLSNMPTSNKRKRNKGFYKNKRAAEYFPKMTKLKVKGKFKVVEGSNSKEHIRKWCADAVL